MRYPALICSIVLSSCSEVYPVGAGVGYCRDLSGPVPVVIDSHWYSDDAQVILDALDEWSDAVGVEWSVSVERCTVGDWYEGCVHKGWDNPMRAGMQGMPDVPSVVVYTTELDRSGDELYPVVLHELGHYLGYQHTESGAMADIPDGVEIIVDDCGR